jgi:hypothetical protein
MNSLFFLNNCGEHYLQTRTFLAIANRIKLKLNGKDIKLLDAYDVVKDSNGISRLELKEGVTKQDGTAFTSRDVMMLSRKSSRINQKMFGIYNMDDANALQQYAVGRLVIMYRKWITPSMNRRFGGRNFSFETQMMDEGYYRTAGSFL